MTNGVYRVEKPIQIGSNDALILGYKGVTFSSSTYSKPLHDFLRNLGIPGMHVHLKYNLSSTKVIDMLLGIKYVIVTPNTEFLKDYDLEYEDLFIENNLKVYKNPYYLSLGYVVDKDTFETNTKEIKNHFEFQNEILKNMTGIDENVYNPQIGNIEMNTEKQEDGNTKVIYQLEAEKEDSLYINITSEDGEAVNLFVNGEQKETLFGDSFSGIVNLGKRKIGEKITIEIETQEERENKIKEINAYYENDEVISKHYEKLKQGQVDMKQIDNRTFEGKINLQNDDEYVMLTIPYEEGFNITVDGEKVKYDKILDTFIAINLNKGEHDILIRYTPDKLILGIFTSIIGIIIFTIFVVIKRSKK